MKKLTSFILTFLLTSVYDALQPYSGPITSLDQVEVSFIHPRGLALEIAPSTISGAGRGLFVRSLENDVIIRKDEILCGYARGTINHGASREEAMSSGYAFEMSFTGDQQKVVYNNSVHRIADLADFADIHTDSAIFLPDEDQSDLNIRTLGHLANDLAWKGPDTSYTEYREASQARNLLGILGQLEELSYSNNKRKILAFSRPVIVAYNEFLLPGRDRGGSWSLAPMEIGIEYGWYYWQ